MPENLHSQLPSLCISPTTGSQTCPKHWLTQYFCCYALKYDFWLSITATGAKVHRGPAASRTAHFTCEGPTSSVFCSTTSQRWDQIRKTYNLKLCENRSVMPQTISQTSVSIQGMFQKFVEFCHLLFLIKMICYHVLVYWSWLKQTAVKIFYKNTAYQIRFYRHLHATWCTQIHCTKFSCLGVKK